MKHRQILTLLLCLGLLLTMAACGGNASAPEADPAEEPPAEGSPETDPADGSAEADTSAETVSFSTEDLQGNPWTQDDLAGQELVMINFWEYWCGPCVSEMPDLEELYQNYKDQGFLILGVFSDESDMEAVESTLETAGTTYPILAYCADFDPYQTGYVPTTIFLDSQGQLVGETVVGSKSYEEWAAIVEGLL